MHDQTILRGALALSVLLATACDRKKEQDQSATEVTSAQTAAETKAEPKAEAKPSEEAEVWPDGFLVVSEEDWIPVLNEAGQKLEAARRDFLAKKPKEAANGIKAAAEAMRNDAKASKEDDQAKLKQDASDLDALAEKLASDKSVDLAELDAALIKAYRDDVRVSWLYTEEETIRPVYERPREHFARALSFLTEHDNVDAANEIRRGTSFFRLAEISARSDDRELLEKDVKRLNEMAKEAEAGKLTPEALRETLSRVDAAYASSYLHQAERQYKAKESVEAGRSLREAAARMRARLHWLGKETELASSAVVDEVESVATKLGKKTKLAAKEVFSLFKKAGDQVKEEPSEKKEKAPHG